LACSEIPLDAIAGSVGRYADFTRSFLPRRESAQERWTRVRAAFDRVQDIPPITVFQIGDSYFVLDGNHRVSVARSLGATHIPAHVTVVESRVPLSAGRRARMSCFARRSMLPFSERRRLTSCVPVPT
jgi:hypothetical protein